ncbi:hypothetical protein [Gemmata sp.]|uniref:hypothetical protein n=1 Tax=Gemmata sp. TaxID=1914242 RepID=UPI003F6F2AFF
MDEVDDWIANFDGQRDKIGTLDKIGATCGDDRSPKLYLSVVTSDKYDLDTRRHATRLLRYAFPDANDVKEAVVSATLRLAATKKTDENLRLDCLEVIMFSDRTYDTVKALVAIMADSHDSQEVREMAMDVLKRHLDKEMIRKSVDQIAVRDAVFNEYCSKLL